jgi:transcriptional antiterminator RfaH
MGLHWYALHTQPHREPQVAHLLFTKGVETFLPMVPTRHRRLGKVDRPLFPCYLFARFDLDTWGLSLVQWTPGLRRVVAFGERPVSIPDEVIVHLQERVRGLQAAGGLPSHHFRPGERVLITDGPLQGLEAVFQGPMRPSERVRVLIEFLGRLAEVEVPLESVERVPIGTRGHPPRRTRGQGRVIRSR